MLNSDHSPRMPIRILHVVTYMGCGGIENMLMNYYRCIDRSKIQFDFLVHRDFRADFDDEIESLGGKIYRLPRLIPWSMEYRKRLNAFFKEHPEYRIVHSHINCLSAVILKAAKKNGVPIRIAHSHTSRITMRLAYPVVLFYRRLIPKYANECLACGKEAGNWLFSGAPYKILNNAIHAEQYVYKAEERTQIRQQLNIPDDAFVVGHVGGISAVKNHTFLIDVFSHIKKQKDNVYLLLIGDGPLRSEIEQKAQSLGLSGNVIFTGVRSDVAHLMQAMDCFVFPSIIEGLPVALLEAQAAGLPCLVSSSVSAEAVKTKTVVRMDLSEGADIWARHVCEMEDIPRADTLQDIVRAGYDVKTNVKFLQDYYFELWKKVL